MPRPGYSPLYQLDFENPILEIERQIDAIEERADADRYADELKQLNETRGGSFARSTRASRHGRPCASHATRCARRPLTTCR